MIEALFFFLFFFHLFFSLLLIWMRLLFIVGISYPDSGFGYKGLCFAFNNHQPTH